MEPLRILTINTGKCDGPYAARIKWLVASLERLRPDVLVCQEVFRSQDGALDTAGALERGLDMSLSWSPARFKRRECEGRDVEGWSGMALLSVHGFAYVDTLQLPSDERDGDRVAQIGLIESGSVSVVMANVHLTYLRDAGELRREQLRRVLDHPLMRMKQAMRLICGDFNQTLDAAAWSGLAGDLGADLRDTFALGGGRGERSTLPPRAGVTSGACVDYIVSLGEDANSHPLFGSSAVVLNQPEPDSGMLPSDHYGVATTLFPISTRGWPFRERSSIA